jgi:hypothetical protein
MEVRFLPVVRAPEDGCGSCTQCCKAMAIKELEKPPDVWCRHALKGRGCGIYADRPESCRVFECVWLSSAKRPPSLRPDRIHGLMTSTPGGHLVLHEDPGWPGHARRALAEMLASWIADGTRYYVVVAGHTRARTFFGNPALLPSAVAMLDETVPPKE